MSNFKDLVRLGKDAEVRYTQGGKAVAGFSAAFDSGWGDNKKAVWLDCSIWGDRASKVAPNLTKGMLILVEGDLGTREYDGKTYLTLDVRDFKFTGKGNDAAPRQQLPVQPATSVTPAPVAPADTFADFDDGIPF